MSTAPPAREPLPARLEPQAPPAPWRFAALILALAAVNWATGRLALELAEPPGFASPVWPPAGIALSALLIGGARLWPGIFLGSAALNAPMAFDQAAGGQILSSLFVALAIAAGSSVQAAVGARWVRRYVGYPAALLLPRDIALALSLGGPLACVLGASLGVTALWAAGLLQAQSTALNWFTWWVGDMIGVLIVAPLMLSLGGEPRSIWRERRRSVAVPLFLTVVATMAGFWVIRRWDFDRLESVFERDALAAASMLLTDLSDYSKLPNLMEGFATVNYPVSRVQFRTFSGRVFESFRGLHAVSWNPLVRDEARDAFEQTARREGLPGFEFRERDSRGRLVRAGRRAEYVAVLYIEGHTDNAAAVGYDVLSEPTRREAIERARDTGVPVASGRVRLVQERGDQWGVLVFRAVYDAGSTPTTVEERRRSVRGLVVCVLRCGEMLRTTDGSESLRGLRLEAIDASAPEDARSLHDSRGAPAESDSRASHPSPRQGPAFVREFPVSFCQRSWLLRLSAPRGYMAAIAGFRAWGAATGGLLFSGLLGAFLLALTGQTARVKDLVEARTMELRDQVREREHAESEVRALNLALESRVTERTAELEAANAALRLQIAAREELQQQFLESQRMQAVGRLAGGIAHDFNNLLTVVVGQCEVLKDSLRGSPELLIELLQIDRAALRATELTRQLLAFGRRQMLRPRLLDPNAAAADAARMLRRVIGERVRVEIILQPDAGVILADPTQIDQVLLNLAVNARDAMPEGGTLAIRTRRQLIDRDAESEVPPGDYVVLEVADDGCGMPPEILKQIFEPFFTTKEVGAGSGLGLAAVYGIVRQSEGFITVTSQPGAGTTFRICLPRVADSLPPDALASPEPVGVEVRGCGNVLVVEDERDVRSLMLRALQRAGYEAIAVEDVESAVALCRAHGEAIDLILTDVIMPGGTGKQLISRVRDFCPKAAVLFVTGYAEESLSSSDFCGMRASLLRKPFTASEVLARVRELLGA